MMIFAMLLLLITAGLHDDSHPPFIYSGEWTQTFALEAYGGSYFQTSTGTLEFAFSGSGFGIYGVFSPTGGSAEVCINGDEGCHVVSWLGDGYTLNVLQISDLQGITTVTVTPLGDGAINIDAIYIAPPQGNSYEIANEDGTA